jgi:tetratricopeptide (TPR) repeat protein
MTRIRILTTLLVALPLACITDERAPIVPEAPAGSRARDGSPDARAREVSRDVTPEPAVEATPRLALRARALADRAQPLAAARLLAKELGERLHAKAWGDPALVDDSVVAALELEALLQQTASWHEALETLERRKPFDAATPPELATQLDFVLARALTRAGRIADARELVRMRGAVSDWRIVGPFANERGGGHDAKYAPEDQLADELDLSATMRGKERDVSWRENPGPGQPLGSVLLHEMLRPAEQGVAYLATAVAVDRPRDACLVLGTTGAVKVWHGEKLVLSRKVSRPFHRDHDRVAVALHEGWNRILVKVGVDEDEAWIASMRVTELDGRPLEGARIDASHAGDATAPAADASEAPSPGARERLALREDADAARLLALYHMQVHPDDKTAHTAKVHAERAASLAPDDVDTLYLLARANEPEIGAKAEEIRHNERLAPLKRVVALEPAHAGALLDLAQFWSTLNPLPESAEEHARRALEAAPGSWRAVSLRAATLEGRGRATEADLLRKTARTSEEGELQPEAVAAAALDLRHHGDPSGEIAKLKHASRTGSSEREVFEALISAQAIVGDLDGALATTEEWLARSPFDTRRMLATARLLEHSERLDDAEALVRRALAVAPDDAQIHVSLARLAQRRNDLETADRELAEVVRLDPGYDLARRQRQLLAATEQDRFEEPYRWDAVEKVRGLTLGGSGNDRVRVVDRTTVWKVEPDGTEHEYEHVLLQVTNSGGVKDLDGYWIGAPSDATLQVYNVRVIHADGTFERAPAPRNQDQGWGGGRSRWFDLPPLVVGDCIDVEYRIDPTRPDVFGQYFGLRHVFQPDFPDPLAPVARAELVVISPKDVPIHSRVHNGDALEESIEERGDEVVHRWIARDLGRPSLQNAMPDRTEFVPLVDVSTFESWQAFASWWWNFIEKEFVTTQAMKDKVAELTAGLSSEEDKVRAIARFVGQEIRYNAWPFGTHGYQPFSAATIFERRFGDCKDKSILLRQMLAEIGVEAHPVLINAQYRRPDEKLDVAMVGHFNHCIAYLPPNGSRPGYYLDATADRNPIEYLRADDQGAKVLHVRDGKGSIEEIEYTAPADNALVRSYVVELDREGRGKVELVDRSVGSFGVGLRYEFGGEKGDLNKRIAESLSEAFGKVDVAAADTSPLEDIGAPARLEVELRAENLWTRGPDGASLRLGFDDIPYLGVAAEPAEEREWDIVLDRPFEMRTSVLYVLPEGAKVKKLPPEATVSAPGLVEYRMKATETPQGILVERTFTLAQRRIPDESYADFQNAMREIQLAEGRTVVIEDTQEEKR